MSPHLCQLKLSLLSHASPHPQPLSQAWERGARGEQESPVPLLPTEGEGVRG
ncbi:hypothetical protein MC7420_7487 [Coleofasciculus chthonoplastes PCC 7420]|uniref:Uncharacterized protein n=1 Tax=Coleofasciculus chthonoplastes PCC 7420 TaxID=118168 RepID=B4VHU2_9CYAN|nr:hypothetical protein MC7420_7487 [Coleofasciculus chthonoplastes PCC 7420]